MKRDSFVFYRSFFDAIKNLDYEIQSKVYNAIFTYQFDDEEIELEGIEKAVFTLIKPQLDANNAKYENGLKGGRPKTKTKPKQNQNKTKPKPNDNENDNENVNENDNIKIHFAEFVTMTNVEYQKLVDTHGKEFADQCITVLDNYKGASGKKYKSDYRAILSWVINKVKGDNPKAKKNVQAYHDDVTRQYDNLNNFYMN